MSNTHLPSTTHEVEDKDDKEDGHAGVQLEHQSLLQLLPCIAAAKLGIWVQSSRRVSAAVVIFCSSWAF
jgi:hypothetical protein